MHDFSDDIAAIQAIDAIPTILDVVCQTTGMGFAAVARVTEDRWIACAVQDRIGFGLQPGGELQVETTICREVRQARETIAIDHVADDLRYCSHATPALYGFQSYISVPIVLRDGTFFGTLCAIDPKPARVDDEKTRGMFRMFADLIAFQLHASQRLEAGEAIRRGAAFTNGILAASPDSIQVISTEGVVEYINERGVALHELDGASAIVGRDFASTWPVDEQPKIRAAIDRAIGGELARIESYCPTARGSPAWCESSFTRFQPDAGEPKVVGISRDITARVRADALGVQAASDLFELNRTLEQRVTERSAALAQSQDALRQAQKMEAVGQLTGGLAHDFNNLLTGISGSLELLQRRAAQGRPAGDLVRYVVAAQGACKRAAALTHRLLAFSRRQTLDPKPTDINRLVGGMEDLINRSVGPMVDVDVVGAPGLWPALVDANQLENALLNLCINARDAMPDGGRITIATTNRRLDVRAGQEQDLPPGQYVMVGVSDSGTGMTQDVIERAFDPFFTTKPIGAGTGLGLSMVYGFARQSGGQVRIDSELGRGTTISICLPRHAGSPDATDEMAGRLGAPLSQHNETILIVDDEPTIRMLVMEILHDFGYVGIEAADGAAGLEILQSDRRVDLLITDVGLPGGMDGRQVADAGRALRPGLKVLFITGYADHAVIGNGRLDLGMEFLTKPFAVDEIAHRIQALVAVA